MNIITNGLLLDKIPNLKNAIIENNVSLEISIHNKKFRKSILKKFKSLFDDDIKFLKEKLNADVFGPDNSPTSFNKFDFQSNNGINHRIKLIEYFFQNSLIAFHYLLWN